MLPISVMVPIDRFAPSRFAGYRDNTIYNYYLDDSGNLRVKPGVSIDGGVTDPRIKKLLGRDHVEDKELKDELNKSCEQWGLKPYDKRHTFWRISNEDMKSIQEHPARSVKKKFTSKSVLGIQSCPEGMNKKVYTNKRVNHAVFSRWLMKNDDGKCRLCQLAIKRLLVASHIKPWAACKDHPKDRINPANGLLLCCAHDALFDKGYISFDENGSIMISSLLNDEARKQLNVSTNMDITIKDGNNYFLEYHRKKIFKQNASTNK